MADQIIQLRRTVTPNPTLSGDSLLPGLPTVCIAPANVTKLWVGDGTAAARLLISSDPADAGAVTAAFLRLAGGTMSGALALAGDPTADMHAANKLYVDTTVANLRQFRDVWQLPANNPDLTNPIPAITAGDYFIVQCTPTDSSQVVPAGVPGVGGQSVTTGDMIIWSELTTNYSIIRGGPITVADADARYLRLAGGILTGNVSFTAGTMTLFGDPTLDMEAVTKRYADGLQRQPSNALPLMSGVPAIGVSLLYAREGHIHPTDTSRAPIDSPTFTGTVTIPAGAAITGYAPLSGPAFTGVPSAPTAPANTDTQQLATTAFVVGQAATTAPNMDGTATIGTSFLYARQDHIHPSDTSRVALAGNVGNPMTGALILNADPTVASPDLQAATKRYVDDAVGSGFSGVAIDPDGSLVGDGLPAAPLGVAKVDGGLF